MMRAALASSPMACSRARRRRQLRPKSHRSRCREGAERIPCGSRRPPYRPKARHSSAQGSRKAFVGPARTPRSAMPLGSLAPAIRSGAPVRCAMHCRECECGLRLSLCRSGPTLSLRRAPDLWSARVQARCPQWPCARRRERMPAPAPACHRRRTHGARPYCREGRNSSMLPSCDLPQRQTSGVMLESDARLSKPADSSQL
jgi:hypothetical protein